jgi:hypothetical protein
VWAKRFTRKRFPLESFDDAKELRSAIKYHHPNKKILFHIVNEHNDLVG